jgi:hypothetical protein
LRDILSIDLFSIRTFSGEKNAIAANRLCRSDLAGMSAPSFLFSGSRLAACIAVSGVPISQAAYFAESFSMVSAREDRIAGLRIVFGRAAHLLCVGGRFFHLVGVDAGCV